MIQCKRSQQCTPTIQVGVIHDKPGLWLVSIRHHNAIDMQGGVFRAENSEFSTDSECSGYFIRNDLMEYRPKR